MFKNRNWLEGGLNSPHNSVLSYSSEKFLVEFSKINIFKKEENKTNSLSPCLPLPCLPGKF